MSSHSDSRNKQRASVVGFSASQLRAIDSAGAIVSPTDIGTTAIGIGKRVSWIECNRLRAVGNGVVVACQFDISSAAIDEGARVLWIERNRLRAIGNGVAIVPQIDVGGAAIDEGARVLWIERDRPRGFGYGGPECRLVPATGTRLAHRSSDKLSASEAYVSASTAGSDPSQRRLIAASPFLDVTPPSHRLDTDTVPCLGNVIPRGLIDRPRSPVWARTARSVKRASAAQGD